MNNKITFWNFLKDNVIEIPIVQRDYAQGRKGKAFIRQTFLHNLKQALDKQQELVLDFVYGSSDGKAFNPLDGQQRLTTLWLLHWYVALRAKCLENASHTLRHFTYETRTSSREFCQQLCHPDFFEKYDGTTEGITEFIRKQTWFYSTWEQDPTIQSMLRMLSGEKTERFELDGIEPIFKNKAVEDFEKYWKSLTEESCIVFYHVNLKNFGLSDDLYIKMNARGKQLTPFENFKADLVGYINEQKSKEWEKLQDSENGIAILLDTKWVDLFWLNHSEDYRIDEIYLAFLNRFFWEELFMAKRNSNDNQNSDESDKYLLKIGRMNDNGDQFYNMEATNPSYAYLNADDSMTYQGIAPYCYDGGNIPIKLFQRLEILLSHYKNYVETYHLTLEEVVPQSSWNAEFSFIPKYANNSHDEQKVSSINQIQRVVFYAICKYFIEKQGTPETFKQWMRVVWNMVTCSDESGRSSIRSTAAIRNVMELLSLLDSHKVYSSLSQQNLKITNVTAIEKRWNEEILKAKQIVNEDGSLRLYTGTIKKKDGNLYHTWEEIITDAENYSFFNGTINFLFTNEEGCVDWTYFDKKLDTVKTFFIEHVAKDKSVMQERYNNAQLLKTLIGSFTKEQFDSVLWWSHRTFNNESTSWMYYLTNNAICTPIHELLIGNLCEIKKMKDSKEEALHILYLLSNTDLLDYVITKIPTSWIRSGYNGHLAIYPSGTGIFLDSQKRNHFLLDIDGVILEDKYMVPNTNLLFGTDINFKYKGKNFQWYRTDYVYLMCDENPDNYAIKDETKIAEVEKFYCFNAKDFDEDCFLKNLKYLADITI